MAKLPGVEANARALGHGLPIACGMAGAKLPRVGTVLVAPATSPSSEPWHDPRWPQQVVEVGPADADDARADLDST